MRKQSLVGWSLVAILTIGLLPVLAQQDDVPILRPRIQTTKTVVATLLVICDLTCNWKLDGVMRGSIAAGEVAKTPLQLGKHLVGASTQDGLDKVETEIEIKTADQIIVHQILQTIRDARIKAEQEAQVKAQEQAVQEQSAREQQDKERQAREQAAHEETERHAEILYKDAQYSEAEPLLNQACAEGSANSCNYLGLMYANGRDVVKDHSNEKSYYSKACVLGSAEGCFNLGNIYNVPYIDQNSDLGRAVVLYSKACNLGHAESCYQAGGFYDNGMAVKQNYQQSISLYNKACDGGSAKGCYFLASSYYNGKGVVMDHQKAMELFSKACSMGDQNGCNMAK